LSRGGRASGGSTRSPNRWARVSRKGHEMFGKPKQVAVVGLDIGSSSVKSVELKETKQGFELVSFGLEPLAQDTVVGRRDHGCAAGGRGNQWRVRRAKDQDQERGHFGFGTLGDREASDAAADESGRAFRPDSERGQPAHPVRYRRRESGLPASGVSGFSDGRFAGGCEERQNFEPHERFGAGGEESDGGGYRAPSRCRTATRSITTRTRVRPWRC
jgi:hypothetical protein